ncbi:o-succinylbenzoate synthase [Frankliniella fusca]|uniref:O-succinylbenzoate synthase n=1 Tax=Frankliniella fusca TaxID=407009 RepID=A0AAE1HVM5_9NEOP|nr:o-succinylbenzoate synthase [Frankliniella fusca]
METLITSKARSCEGVKRKQDATRAGSYVCCTPKSYQPPLLCALTTDLHSRLGCREEIDLLNSFGLLVSYHEAKCHEFSVASHKRGNEGVVSEAQRAPLAFTHYVFDNFDHDPATLDRHDTVHILGAQRIVTPLTAGTEVKIPCVPRRPLPSWATQIAQDLDK